MPVTPTVETWPHAGQSGSAASDGAHGPRGTAGRERPLELAALLVLALALRLPGVRAFDLWQDEIYSIYEATYLLDSPIGPGGIELRALYFVLLHPLAEAFPRATALLRAPSLVFGLASIAVTWWLARRYAGRGPAFVAAAVMTLLPLHMNASTLIRWIAFITMVGGLLSVFTLRALETDRTRDHLVTLGLLLTGTLTHITFLMPQTGLVLGAHLVREDGRPGLRWPTRRALLTCWVPYLLIVAALYAMLMALVPAERLLGAPTGGDTSRFLPAVAYHLTPPVLLAAAFGAAQLYRLGGVGPRRLALMAVAGMAVPTLTLLVGGARGLVPVSVIYLSGALPAFLAAVGAAALAVTGERTSPARAAVVLAGLLGAALLPSTVSQFLDGSRFQFRAPLAQVAAQDPRATVLVNPVIHARWEEPTLDAVEFKPEYPVAFLDSLATTGRPFWVVAVARRHGMHGDADGAKQRWLTQHCRLEGTWRRPRFDFELFATELYRCP